MNRKALTLLLATIGLPFTASAGNQVTVLDDWQFFGDGFIASVGSARLVSEYPGSKGVMLVSPKSYDCPVSLEFDVLPLNPETVLVVMLASSDAGAASTLSLADDYDGNIVHLLNNVDSYFFAFHNAAHNRTPFVRRHPFIRGESSDLDAAANNVLSTQWHTIEASCDSEGRLRLTVDGTVILEATDKAPMAQGNIALRLRGTKTHVASALFRHVTVKNCEAK